MLILLTLLTIALNATIFSDQVPQQFLANVQMAAIALPTLLLIVLMLNLGKNNRSEQNNKQQTETEDQVSAPAAAKETTCTDTNEAAVVQFLAQLQEKGRILDFLMDDITAYDNESVGAAARIVHQGCNEVIHDNFTVETVFEGEEMEHVSLADNYDSRAYRLTGNVPDTAPFEGNVLHRGWKTTRVNLPQVITTPANLSSARTIIAPAEIELD